MADVNVVVARTGARAVVGGRSVRLLAGTTTAHVDAPIVREHPDWWRPLAVDFPAEPDGGALAPTPPSEAPDGGRSGGAGAGEAAAGVRPVPAAAEPPKRRGRPPRGAKSTGSKGSGGRTVARNPEG